MIFIIKIESCYIVAAAAVVTNETCNYTGQAVEQKRVERNNSHDGSSSSNNKRNRSSKFRSYFQGAYSRQIGPLGVDWKIIREQYAFDTYCVWVCAFAQNILYARMQKGVFNSRPFLSAPIHISHSRLLLLRILFWCRDNHMMIYNYIFMRMAWTLSSHSYVEEKKTYRNENKIQFLIAEMEICLVMRNMISDKEVTRERERETAQIDCRLSIHNKL